MDIVINNKIYVVKLSKINQGKMVLNVVELVFMELILFLSVMFQVCQFQFFLKYNYIMWIYIDIYIQRYKCIKVYNICNIVLNWEMLL